MSVKEKLKKATERVASSDRKFEASDMDAELRKVAQVYLSKIDHEDMLKKATAQGNGALKWLASVAAKFQDKGIMSDAIAKGALNFYRAQLIREARNGGKPSEYKPREADVTGKNIPDGTYTVIFDEESDDRVTIKVNTVKSGDLLGKRIIAYLNGPDNWRNYKGFGFVVNKDDSEQADVRLWKRFADNDRLKEAARVLFGDPLAAAKAYGIQSGSCCVCGRVLTVPESIAKGIGPVCEEKF